MKILANCTHSIEALDTVEVQVPFEGGFQSSLEDAMDCELDQAREAGASDPDITDYRDYLIECGKVTITELNRIVNGKDPLFTYADLASPQEYNFGTDRLFANVPRHRASALWDIVMGPASRGGLSYKIRKAVREIAREELTPRSGFIPHYDTNPLSWSLEHSIDTLPACLWGIMFRGFLQVLWEETTSGIYESLEEELFHAVHEYVSSNGIAGQFVDAGEPEEEEGGDA